MDTITCVFLHMTHTYLNPCCLCHPDWHPLYAAGQTEVWVTKPLIVFCLCRISIVHSKAYITVHRTFCNSIALIFIPPSRLLLIYSSEHLSSIAFPIRYTGHARPNNSYPIASGVCAQFPYLPYSVHLPSPSWDGGYESSLHPVVWKAALSQMTIDDNAAL